MATLVLVHPAWFGGWCWKKVASRLQLAGHTVHTPTLTGLGERAHLATSSVGLRTHIDDVVSLFEFEDLDEVTLVGTSSAGTVVTGVADLVAERIAQVVYLDAFVPSDGQSTWDLIPADRRPAMESLVAAEGGGWLLPRLASAPWEPFLRDAWEVTDDADLQWVLPRLRPTPFGHVTERLERRGGGEPRAPRVYIRCRRWPNAHYDSCAAAAEASSDWVARELPTSHVPYITHADELTAVLLDLVR